MLAWALGPIIAAGIALFAWALKRVVGSVIDERVMPAVQKIHDRVDAHMEDEEASIHGIHSEIARIRSDVSYIAGSLGLRLPSGNGR